MSFFRVPKCRVFPGLLHCKYVENWINITSTFGHFCCFCFEKKSENVVFFHEKQSNFLISLVKALNIILFLSKIVLRESRENSTLSFMLKTVCYPCGKTQHHPFLSKMVRKSLRKTRHTACMLKMVCYPCGKTQHHPFLSKMVRKFPTKNSAHSFMLKWSVILGKNSTSPFLSKIVRKSL